jgi:hypothetical protein
VKKQCFVSEKNFYVFIGRVLKKAHGGQMDRTETPPADFSSETVREEIRTVRRQLYGWRKALAEGRRENYTTAEIRINLEWGKRNLERLERKLRTETTRRNNEKSSEFRSGNVGGR